MSFTKMATLMASAAALVSAEFLLFGKFLTRLAPPVHDIDIKVGVACFCSLFALMLIGLLAKNQSAQRKRTLIAISVVFFTVGIGLYFYYENQLGDFVYRYPTVVDRSNDSTRHIRGELHEVGRKRLGTQALPAVIADLGGVEFVTGQQLLWTETSQRSTELKLTALYLFLSVSIGAALFPLVALSLGSSVKRPLAKK